MRTAKTLLSAALASGLLLLGPSRLSPARAGGAQPETSAGPQHTPQEQRFLELTNRERVNRGLRPLTVDPLLITVARQHSREMMEKNYFDHVSPTPGYKTPMDRYLKALGTRPKYATVGENLYYCSVVDVERGHQAFMNSPSHRENVLFPRFEKMGVGIHKNARGEFWVTEMYLTNSPG
jgi:uncharacterized protein YkwD